VYWLNQKEGFHVDESLSIVLACYNDYMWKINYEFGREYTGKEVKEISLCDNDHIKNAFGDVYRLWQDNRDSPHTNFYYSLLRLSLAGLKTGNIQDIIFRAGILNIILFTISFFFFFGLARLLFKENEIIPLLSVFCAFMSTASLSNTLFLRPYQLQECMFVLFAYFFARYVDRKKFALVENRLYINSYTVFIMAFITVLTLLTGYYSVLFIGMFGLYVIYNNIRAKNIREIQAYIIILVSALCFAQVFYLRYIPGFLSGRASETAQTVWQNGFFRNLTVSGTTIAALITRHFFTIPVIVLFAVLFVYLLVSKQKIVFTRFSLLLFFTAFIYTCIITYIAPYKTLRYSMAVFPFLIFLPAAFLCSLKNKYISRIASVLLCVIFSLNSFDGDRIENLYKGKPEQYAFNEDKNVPVLVINKTSWKYADIVPYFNDEQTYFFNDTIDNVTINNKYDEIYLVVESELGNTFLPNYEIESEFAVSYFTCRKLKK
jgi:hypothetical protein